MKYQLLKILNANKEETEIIKAKIEESSTIEFLENYQIFNLTQDTKDKIEALKNLITQMEESKIESDR